MGQKPNEIFFTMALYVAVTSIMGFSKRAMLFLAPGGVGGQCCPK